MNTKTEANLNRMSNEVHLITSPIRSGLSFLKFVVIFCLASLAIPFVVVGLIAHYVITGRNILDADGVLALKVLYTFCAPVLTCVGYRFCQAVSGRRARVKATYEFSMHKVFLITLGLMVLGALVMFKPYCDMSTDMGLVALVCYLSSPMLLLLVKKGHRASATPRCSKIKCLWSS
jgi:hypothetical protein